MEILRVGSVTQDIILFEYLCAIGIQNADREAGAFRGHDPEAEFAVVRIRRNADTHVGSILLNTQ